MALGENKTSGKSGSRPERRSAPPSAASGGYVQSLAADFEGARGNFGCKCQVSWPRPFKAAEAER